MLTRKVQKPRWVRFAREPVRFQHPISVAVFALALASSAPAGAQLQGVAGTSLGYTDNVTNAPVSGSPPPEGGAFGELRPGIVYSFDTGRAIHAASYAFTYDFFFDHSEANSYSNQLSWLSAVALSASTRLSLGVSGSEGETNTFRQVDPAAGGLELHPAGSAQFILASLQEELGHDFSNRWSGLQSTSFTVFAPINSEQGAPNNYTFSNTLGATRAWQRHAFGADLNITYTLTPESDFQDAATQVITTLPATSQLLETLLARWQYDLSYFWTMTTTAGALLVTRATDFGGSMVHPAGGISFRYGRQEGEVEVAYSHGGQPNPLVGETTVSDSITLRGGLPLGEQPGFALAGSSGYSHGYTITQQGTLDVPTHLIQADAALTFNPVTMLGLAVRFQHGRQFGDNPTTPEIIRSTGLFEIGVTFPDPARPPRVYRRPARVDRSDDIFAPQNRPAPPRPPPPSAPPARHR